MPNTVKWGAAQQHLHTWLSTYVGSGCHKGKSVGLRCSAVVIYKHCHASVEPTAYYYVTHPKITFNADGPMVQTICTEVAGFIIHHLSYAAPMEANTLWILVINGSPKMAYKLTG